MFSIIRESRSYSSTADSSTARYSAASRGRDSATCASPSRLLIGVRRSCARSEENSERRLNESSRRSSMWLNASVDSRNSSGVSSSDSRSFRARALMRSEEHTSELQSQSNLVCRLLLEKKKKEQKITHYAAMIQRRSAE